jgi:hypothetical protein
VRLSDLSCASMTKEQVKWGPCGVSQAKRLRFFERFREMFANLFA